MMRKHITPSDYLEVRKWVERTLNDFAKHLCEKLRTFEESLVRRLKIVDKCHKELVSDARKTEQFLQEYLDLFKSIGDRLRRMNEGNRKDRGIDLLITLRRRGEIYAKEQKGMLQRRCKRFSKVIEKSLPKPCTDFIAKVEAEDWHRRGFADDEKPVGFEDRTLERTKLSGRARNIYRKACEDKVKQVEKRTRASFKSVIKCAVEANREALQRATMLVRRRDSLCSLWNEIEKKKEVEVEICLGKRSRK